MEKNPAVISTSPDMPAAQVPAYPRNCWWVAATVAEVQTRPIGRRILEEPIVLYRKADGEVVALEDRCAHRWAPLSLGRVVGNDIVCGYHGFRYAADGRCVHVPTQSAIPPRAKVRAYRAVERKPFVWIWTGDERRIDNVPLPPVLEWVEDPAWLVVQGGYLLEAGYMALKENVLDLTHFAYVHAKTFQIMDYLGPPSVRVDGQRISYRQEFSDMPLPALYGEPTGIGQERPVTRVNEGAFVSPAMQEATVIISDAAAAPGQRDRFEVKIVHMTTPITPTKTMYWWVRGQDFGHRPGMKDDLQRVVESAFAEDKVILEATQTLIDTDPRHRNSPEINVLADQAGRQIRRVVSDMIRQETEQRRLSVSH